ncbi:MAG: tRNA (N6-threonylcarbamoyladenosine(37)-N6)-methyltransferase TrmO [Actinobacteria bacterium]|nr:tRNA (N6-threonylcarbamoyladenosine(37)-N6)-methyltransferase TrmO [Actinomycetota bacterium]
MGEEFDSIIKMKAIGIIHSPFKNPKDMPIQPAYAGKAKGQVLVYSEYEEGLKDIDGFSHIKLIYYFHLAGNEKEVQLRRRPYLDSEAHGIFAIRHFSRPNPIGVSVVKLKSVEGNVLNVEGIDVIDGTPLLDIKPYVPGFRAPGRIRIGWLKDKNERVTW